MKGWPHRPPGSIHRPLLFLNSGVGSFTSHKNQISESAVSKTYSRTVFHPYLRTLERLTICRCHCKGSNFFSVIYGEIRCIALCILQTLKDFWVFVFRQSSLADLLGNTCLPARVQKVMVCDS